MNARLAQMHGGGGDNAQRTAEDQRAPPPQQIGGHAAGDLTQQADAVENALGQADLRQRKPRAASSATQTASVKCRVEVNACRYTQRSCFCKFMGNTLS